MRLIRTTAVLLAAALLPAAACSAQTGDESATGGANATWASGPCPVEPVDIVVSIDQWRDIAEQLAGPCGNVTTIVTGDVGDPHDFEPTTADMAAFETADVAVVNGADYDTWAVDALVARGNGFEAVSADRPAGWGPGMNPHLWYDPRTVQQMKVSIGAALALTFGSTADTVLDAQRVAWEVDERRYFERIAAITAEHEGATYVATEGVFDLMATALGLTDLTPEGYRTAAANEVDPSPGDISSFEDVLRSGDVDVLIYNSQTEGALPEQLRAVAEEAGVPVVEVTETTPPGVTGFFDWQLAQLDALDEALRG